MENKQFAKQLCDDVIRVLDMQKEYFKTKNPQTLSACKAAEAELRTKATMGQRMFEDKIGMR